MKVIILTGTDLRHDFFRKFIANSKEIEVLQSYCEEKEINLRNITEQDFDNTFRLNHLHAREQSENDFFSLFANYTKDNSNPKFIRKGEINQENAISSIIESNPDIIIAYGCSIIRGSLLSIFKGRFINVHLGLSPYYRGSGTNFWPLVNKQPELVGVTFMHINEGIDTGEIIHQVRAKYVFGDTPSTVGNRLIVDMSKILKNIIVNFSKLRKMKQFQVSSEDRIYRKKDYSEQSVKSIYNNFKDNLIQKYLSEEDKRNSTYPIINNVDIWNSD
jgi:phosphoribosylglycinamide formyltransferase 1